MSYVDESLAANEGLVYRARFHWLHKIGAWIILALFVGGAAGCLAIAQGVAALIGAAALTLAGIGIFVMMMMPMWTTEIAVTSQRFIYKRGWLTRTTDELQLTSILPARDPHYRHHARAATRCDQHLQSFKAEPGMLHIVDRVLCAGEAQDLRHTGHEELENHRAEHYLASKCTLADGILGHQPSLLLPATGPDPDLVKRCSQYRAGQAPAIPQARKVDVFQATANIRL